VSSPVRAPDNYLQFPFLIDYPVQLDTGSSDLWVKPLSGSLLGATSTVCEFIQSGSKYLQWVC